MDESDQKQWRKLENWEIAESGDESVKNLAHAQPELRFYSICLYVRLSFLRLIV